jgi:opacity protein-like surface antigen
MMACAATVFAQGDYNKLEVYGGYSYARIDPNSGTQTVTEGPDTFTLEPCTPDGADVLGSDLQRFYSQRRNAHGFDTSITYNFTRYLGIKGDVTGHFKTSRFADQFTDMGVTRTDTNVIRERSFNFLIGLQVKDNSREARFKPFAQALAGFARQTAHDVQTSTGGFNFTLDDKVTSFAMKFGGGLDLRLSPRVDLRVIEVDYNPIFTRDRAVPGNADFALRVAGKRADNLTIGVGIVIH